MFWKYRRQFLPWHYIRFARHSPKISGSATEFPFRMERQVRMLLRRVLQGLVTLVFAKCKNKVLASLRSSDG